MRANILLFPGCLVAYRFPEYESAATVLLKRLDYRVSPPPFALCCGAMLEGASADWVNYAACNLALAGKIGADIVTLCGGCANTLRRAQRLLAAEPAVRDKVASRLRQAGLSLDRSVAVRHLLEVINERAGDLAAMATRPLAFKVAPVYPCQVFRPGDVMQFDHPLRPHVLAELISLTGCSPVAYPQEHECCGASFYMTSEALALAMGKNRIESVRLAGADAAVTACGNCHLLLERLQPMFAAKPFPVLFFPQLIALSIGHSPAELGLKSLAVRRLIHNAGL
jgi:heterodisulfide reductase subunit B